MFVTRNPGGNGFVYVYAFSCANRYMIPYIDSLALSGVVELTLRLPYCARFVGCLAKLPNVVSPPPPHQKYGGQGGLLG